MRNVFRTVIIVQRNIELREPYIVINENISPKLYEFLTIMQNTKFEEGAYNTFYGGLKVVVNNFVVYWSDIINDCIKDVDALCHGITKDAILELIDRSVSVHQDKHTKFVKSFCLLKYPEETNVLEDVEHKYQIYKQGMAVLRQEVAGYERQDQFDQFIIKYSELGMKKKNEVFEMTHTIMALCLAEDVSTVLII